MRSADNGLALGSSTLALTHSGPKTYTTVVDASTILIDLHEMGRPSNSINHRARHLILDFALGAAIIALLPIPRLGLFKAIALLLLNLLMLRNIMRYWRTHRGGSLLAKFGIPLGIAGALLAAFLVWLVLVGLGAIIPAIAAFAPGAAVFSYFWLFGQTINHYYLSGLAVEPKPLTASEEHHEI